MQVYVSRLRKLLPPDTLLTRAPGYLLEVEPDDLDLRCFERLLAEGHEALAEGNAERAAGALHQALELWRGPALAEFAFEPFAQTEIGRLEDLRLVAVEERIEADLALGRHADLIGELEALIAENPYRERLRAQLMLALYRSGRQAEALEAYQDARRALVDELGIEPSGDLQRLEKAILTQDKELDPPSRSQRVAGLREPPASAPALERKLVTVLFADLVMTNELEEDPEQAAAFLDRVHEEAERGDRGGRGHRRERRRRRAARDVRPARGSRGPRGQRRARDAQPAHGCVRRRAVAAHGRRERRGDPRPARLVRHRDARRGGGPARSPRAAGRGRRRRARRDGNRRRVRAAGARRRLRARRRARPNAIARADRTRAQTPPTVRARGRTSLRSRDTERRRHGHPRPLLSSCHPTPSASSTQRRTR